MLFAPSVRRPAHSRTCLAVYLTSFPLAAHGFVRPPLIMDAHIFRLLAPALCLLCSGMRIEKIFSPFPEATVFHCFNRGEKFRLILCTSKHHPALFLLSGSLQNPAQPPASIMRLRKYLGGARLGEGIANFSLRSLAFPVLRKPDLPPLWVRLSLREGVTLHSELPEEFSAPPLWPPPEDYLPLAKTRAKTQNQPGTQPATTGAWLAYPLLTPSLRETLAHSDPLEAQALMGDLEYGGDTLFFYQHRGDGHTTSIPARYYAWPLPDRLAAHYALHPEPLCVSQPELSAEWGPIPDSPPPVADHRPFALPAPLCTPMLACFRLLVAASAVEEQTLFTLSTTVKGKGDAAQEGKRVKRLQKTLQKLEKEEQRLAALVQRQGHAIRIQESLWAIDAEQKTALLSLPGERTEGIPLDPRFSVKENMQKIFLHATRSKRGLDMLAVRRKALQDEMAGVASPPAPSPPPKADAPATAHHAQACEASETTAQHGATPIPGKPEQASLIARFMSSDGYTLLRGKNARGNHLLVKTGQPHDYWLHSADGPSAHVLVRRAHANDEVPDSTLEQAALLVAERSWQRDDAHASIMVALLRHVKNIKKAAPGTVRVDKILQNVSIRLG